MAQLLLFSTYREKKIHFEGSTRTLQRVVHDIGFSYVRRRGHRYLVEKPEIKAKQRQFLKAFMSEELQNKKKIYLDETWIFQNGSSKTREWQDNDHRSCSVKKLEGSKRFIVAHAGGRDGFVPNGFLLFTTNVKPAEGDDYHEDMNAGVFNSWLTTKILPNLPADDCVIVIDNAP